MKRALKSILPIAEAISTLMHPFAEVVVHDMKRDRIEAIFNPISRREVGDNSYLDRLEFEKTEPIIGPYEKINWDGRKLKSISVIIKNECNVAQGCLCINVDVSHFDSIRNIIGSFIGNNSLTKTEEQKLFKDDLYEQINIFVRKYCLENHVAVNALNREDKRSIIGLLEDMGAFKGRNATSYVSRILGISRASVYNYLKAD